MWIEGYSVAWSLRILIFLTNVCLFFEGKNCSDNNDGCLQCVREHTASCVDTLDGYTCQCLEQYTGVNCEVASFG